jgi:RHS repeat-associated protein
MALFRSTCPETNGGIGDWYDAGAGLQYLYARYYDPVRGMFLQPDWFQVMGGDEQFKLFVW